jgi:hypothetical protein
LAVKAVNEHRRIGGAKRTAGEKSKRQALLCVEAIFSRRRRHLAKTERDEFEKDKQSICRKS